MPRKPANKDTQSCLYRAVQIFREDARDEDRSIPMVLATETPVDVVDFQRMEVIKETLKLDGLQRMGQVPLIDSHDRSSIRNVIGSIRDMTVSDGKLTGRAYFASDAESQRAYEKYRDGHLTDFSIGASIKASHYDDNGDRVVTRSQLLEGSAVVAGQDPNAVVLSEAMRAYADPYSMKDQLVDKKLRELLIARGMPEDATETESLQFVEANLSSTIDEEEATTVVVVPDEEAPADPVITTTPAATTEEEDDMAATTDIAAAVAAERSRINGINALCRKAQATEEIRSKYANDGTMTVERAAVELWDKQKPGVGNRKDEDGPPKGEVIRGGESDKEKWYTAVHGGIISRAADAVGANPKAFLAKVAELESGSRGKAVKYNDADAVRRNKQLEKEMEDPVDGADEFKFASLPDIAREFLVRSGERVHGLPTSEICRRAIAQPMFVSRSGPAIHTTGSFTNLMLDAANKTLLAGYDEAEHSYTMWVRQAPSAADFKQLHRIRFGEMADPEVVPENNPYPEKTTQDARESYGVEKYGEIFSISLEAIVNDDLNAMIRIPQMQGFAMRRKVNKVVYNVLTSNPNLSDGVAIFHSTSHGANLDATALSEAAMDVGFTVMGTQTGLSGAGTPLGLRPSYLIVPAALAATATRLVTGGVVPVNSGSTVPLYGPGRPRSIVVVEEPQLDADSTTAWYLAANSGAVETIEITFLQGEESPVLSREDGFSTDTIKYKIRQTFAAKCIDFRGLYQGNA